MIAQKLERIADHSYNIAKYVVNKEQKIPQYLFDALDFETMYLTVDKMLKNITVAYKEKDVKAARKVFKKDKILDKIKLNSFTIIEKEIKNNSAIIADALLLFSVINKIERVGDLIKNIAEELIFYIDAEVLRHRKEK